MRPRPPTRTTITQGDSQHTKSRYLRLRTSVLGRTQLHGPSRHFTQKPMALKSRKTHQQQPSRTSSSTYLTHGTCGSPVSRSISSQPLSIASTREGTQSDPTALALHPQTRDGARKGCIAAPAIPCLLTALQQHLALSILPNMNQRPGSEPLPPARLPSLLLSQHAFFHSYCGDAKRRGCPGTKARTATLVHFDGPNSCPRDGLCWDGGPLGLLGRMVTGLMPRMRVV